MINFIVGQCFVVWTAHSTVFAGYVRAYTPFGYDMVTSAWVNHTVSDPREFEKLAREEQVERASFKYLGDVLVFNPTDIYPCSKKIKALLVDLAAEDEMP